MTGEIVHYVRRILRGGLNRAKRLSRRLFPERLHVFVHRGPFKAVAELPVHIFRYDNYRGIPELMRQAIIREDGTRAFEMDRQEIDEGSVIWIGCIENRVVGVCLTCRGRHFNKWLIPINDRDIVFGRVRTFLEYRGQGVNPLMMRHIMYKELTGEGWAYTDCSTRNHASIRSIVKAGFTHIATTKVISRLQARGADWHRSTSAKE